MSEHDWEKLYVVRQRSRATLGLPPDVDLVYTDLDKCSKCEALSRVMPDSVKYKSKDWTYNTLEEPLCVEAEDRKYRCPDCGLEFEETPPEGNIPGTKHKIRIICPSCYGIAEEAE